MGAVAWSITLTDWTSMTCCATLETLLAMSLAMVAAISGSVPVTESVMTREVVSLVTLVEYPFSDSRCRSFAVSASMRSLLRSVDTSLAIIWLALRLE